MTLRNYLRSYVSFKVKTISPFERELKRLVRKHRSLADEYGELVQQLKLVPTIGTSIGQGCYKIRLKVASKGGGKSGGARVVTCIVAVQETVYLLSIYDKAEQATITDQRLAELLKLLPIT